MAPIQIRIIFEGHFIGILEYLNICAHHCLSMPAEKKYWCHYPHQSRDWVSPVCGILFFLFLLALVDFGLLTKTPKEVTFPGCSTFL